MSQKTLEHRIADINVTLATGLWRPSIYCKSGPRLCFTQQNANNTLEIQVIDQILPCITVFLLQFIWLFSEF